VWTCFPDSPRRISPTTTTMLVQGVIIGDMGVDREGKEKDSYVQGIEIRAPMTVLAEGCRGHLTKRAIRKYGLDADSDPQTYAIGMKELWQLPEGRVREGHIQHTVGWPLPSGIYGGSFVYHLDKNRVAVGFVCGLDYQDPDFTPFEAFQQFKHHPEMHACSRAVKSSPRVRVRWSRAASRACRGSKCRAPC
jgi:electron-transferring-flavoprotein dehydrogenase